MAKDYQLPTKATKTIHHEGTKKPVLHEGTKG